MLHYLAIPQWYERTNEATDELGQRIISKLQEQLADCLYVLYEMLSFVASEEPAAKASTLLAC